MKLIHLFEAPVGNFNQNRPKAVNSHFYRGGRPLNAAAIKELKGLGIETVVCLLKTGKTYPAEISGAEAEKQFVEDAGMEFIAINMDEARDPSDADIKRFLKATKEGGKVYAHCSAGQDRVGVLAAIFDVEVLDMSYDEAYERYLRGGHDFHTWPNLDRFFYRWASKKFGDVDPRKAIDKVIHSKRTADWLYDFILEV